MDIAKQFIDLITGKWSWLFIVSILGSIGFVILALPQFIKVLRTRNTTGITLSFAIILPITNTLLLTYSIGLFVITFTSGTFPWAILFTLVFNGLISCYGIMIIKIKNVKASKKLNMSEVDYYEKYLKPKYKCKKRK